MSENINPTDMYLESRITTELRILNFAQGIFCLLSVWKCLPWVYYTRVYI